MTPDHQSRGRKAIKGATAATGYESKPLDLPTFPPADAKSCTSCANFNFCGISFQAASTAHNVHEVNGCPGKRHPVLPQSLAKLLCLALQFFQLFLVLWRKYSIQEVKRRGTRSEVHSAKPVRDDGGFSNSQCLCFCSTFQRRSTKCWENATSASQKRPPEDSQNSLGCS